jgi:hypothetical protein
MTDPNKCIAKLRDEIVSAGRNGNVLLEEVLLEALLMIGALRKERDAAEAAHFILGYN